MQTVLAFAFRAEVSASRVADGLRRVEHWYAPLWREQRVEHGAAAGRCGVQVWDERDSGCTWPVWWSDLSRAVVTAHAPLGYAALIGSVPPADAPPLLAAHLRRRPEDVLQLTAPFFLIDLDRHRGALRLTTDALGIGRLFELQTPEGTFWSNRPVAMLRFAGVRAEPDLVAWRRMAACDWAMGDASPYRGVRVVPAATVIEVDAAGCRRRCHDPLPSWTAPAEDPLDRDAVTHTASALVESVSAIGVLWPEPPVLSLSGGRDSRLVAAAYAGAEAEFRVRTYPAANEELATVARLAEALPDRSVQHRAAPEGAAAPLPHREGAWSRALRWHDRTEGLRPAVYLPNVPPQHLLRHRPALVCGVGGEFAHAPGYPADIERLERLPLTRRVDAFTRSLAAKVVLPHGLHPQARAEVDVQIGRVLERAVAGGAADSRALVWFYGDERLRRWGLAGESHGRVMPLLAPSFVRAGYRLSTAQSLDSALHTSLIARLVPAWAGIGYVSPTLRQRQTVRRPRLWEETDLDELAAVFASGAGWAEDGHEDFDVRQVRDVWARARSGHAAARDELLLQRVIWRAAFSSHLAAVNDATAPADSTAELRRRSAPGDREQEVSSSTGPRRRAPLDLVRRLASHANDLPLARRLARTVVGRWLRAILGV